MPRFRNSIPRIHSEKHEMTWSNLIQDASSVVNIILMEGKSIGDVSLATDVKVGSTVRAIYLEFHFANQDDSNAVPQVIHWTVEVQRTGMAVGAPNLYNVDAKSFIIKRGMEMLPKDTSTVYKRIILVKIPKIYQRVKLNSSLHLKYIASGPQVINACGIGIYKELY